VKKDFLHIFARRPGIHLVYAGETIYNLGSIRVAVAAIPDKSCGRVELMKAPFLSVQYQRFPINSSPVEI
jgi:hypothetical protein